jgi:hypothetical protein
VTALTGSPMAETGIELPTRSAVTSAAVMILSGATGSLDPAAGINAAATNDGGQRRAVQRPDRPSANAARRATEQITGV